MNSNWIEMVETLQPHIVSNSVERDYHKEIEYCFRFLGWKRSNGTIKSEVSKDIGNNNSIRIDILLSDQCGNPVLPIEIKRPNNKCCSRQESQLLSYMRLLRLNVGLYIGENIQLFYDNPDDSDGCISVFRAELRKDDSNGELLCEMLSYDGFKLKSLEVFCKERYDQIKAVYRLQEQLNDFLSLYNASKNIVSLIKEKFIKEGFDEFLIEKALRKYSIHVDRIQQNEAFNLKKEIVREKVVVQKDKKGVKFSIDKINYYGVGPFVKEVIKKYVLDNPSVTYNELISVFPPYLCGSKENGVIRTVNFLEENPSRQRNFFMKEPIRLSDNNVIVVNSQWGNSGQIRIYFQKFLKHVESIYPVYTKEG